MNLTLLGKIVLVSLVVSLVVVVGVFYFVPTKNENVAATPGPGFDSPYVTFNGNEYYYYYQPMVATSTALCTIQNPFRPATTTILSYSARVTANRTGANSQLVDLATTTANGGFGSSSPPMVLGHAFVTSGNGSSWGRQLAWLPSTATTTKTGGASGAGVLEAFNSVSGASNALLVGNEYLSLRIATATAMTVTEGTNDIDGVCQGVFKKN